MTLDFTEAEGRALLEMLDLACKAGGIRYAEAAVVWSKKVVEARAAEAKRAELAVVDREPQHRTMSSIG